jgi:glycine cleavage system transcriptional repressor
MGFAMDSWFMLTVVGEDRPGIVAKLTHALFEGGCNLGEASMIRLGGSFTVMLMVKYSGSEKLLSELIEPVIDSLGLHQHIDIMDGGLHQHQVPDARVTVFGADRAGIVAQVTGVLAEAGLNILDLESDVGGSDDKPIYIMIIEGCATEGIESLQSALDIIIREGDGIEATIEPIETLIG